MSGSAAGSAFVGRIAELRALSERRLAAARGRGSCVVVSGEAGIGKSRLITALREGLDRRQAAFGFARANEFGNAPYEPLLAALKDLGRNAAVPLGGSMAEQLAAVAAEVAKACEKRSCVLVLEDAQWADEGTWRFLLHLLPFVSSMRLLIIVAYRLQHGHREDLSEAYIVRLYRNSAVGRIELSPLSVAEMREMLRQATGTRLHLPAVVVEEIVERSEGNAFFAEELLKSALERGTRDGPTRELPLTIRAAVLERWSHLDDAARAVLRGAAIMGRRFDADFLCDVLEKPRADVLDALNRLRELHVIDERSDLRPRYSFHHALTRDAVYSTMLADETKPLHERIFQTLERYGGSTYDLGYHASAAGSTAAAVRYNERAGDEAAALYAYADARICYQRALSHAQTSLDRARLLEKAATAAGREGAADTAEALFGRAITAYEDSDATDKVVDAAVAMSAQARHAGSAQRSRSILREVLARVPRDAAVARGRLAIALAFTHIDSGELDEAAALVDQSSAVAQTPAYANTVAYAAAARGDLAALRPALQRYIERCKSSVTELLPSAKFNAAFQLCILGIDDEALAAFELLLPQLRERHLTSLEVLACANAALIEGRAGRWPRARALVERALAIPEPATTGPAALAAAGITVALAQHDETLAARFDVTAAIDYAFASGINSMLGRLAGPYARWLHRRGDVEEAQSLLRNAMRRLAVPFGATETLLAAMELGDETTKRDVLRLLPALDAMSSLSLYAATSAHLRALSARATGDTAAAGRYSASAAAGYRELGWPDHERRAQELSANASVAVENTAGSLSTREREIAALVARGVPNKLLAAQLSVSQRTIEKHLTSIFDKLGLRNRAELTAFVVRNFTARAPDARMK